MTEVSLGKTGITVNKNGFGALPIQRIPQDDAVKLVRRAFERGINFFDTARSYTDSEAKLGVALKGIREQVFIATKTPSVTAAGFWNDLETSLRLLQTDYIDIYQFHNPAFCPKPGDGSGFDRNVHHVADDFAPDPAARSAADQEDPFHRHY